ncbi:MAG: hypothetical protein AAF206_14205 [Bacteroidota bacterium]
MFVDLQGSVPDKQTFASQYLEGIDQLYFRVRVDISGNGAWDYVPGYAQIEDYGVINGSGNTVGWIKLKNVGIKDDNKGEKVHPIAKASWNYCRLNTPRLIYNPAQSSNEGESGILNMVGFISDVKSIFVGINKVIRKRGFGKKTEPGKSWIRLNNPDGKKHGGDLRVKQITLSDSWDDMVSGGEAATYGQTYEYVTEDPSGNEISSGVAAYEPIIGGDENPFRQPKFFKESNLLAPDNEHYVEYPMGESFFPGPTVVYSKVKIRELGQANVTRNATGEAVHEFYTAKDFPTITEYTKLEAKHKKPNFILNFFKIGSKEYMTASQGYVIKLNDMHGKEKASWIYAEGKDQPISGMEYFYHTKSSYSAQFPNELDNDNLDVIFPDGNIDQNATIGKDIEMVIDQREQLTETAGFTTRGNVDGFLAFIFPIIIPTIWPQPVSEKNRFRSITATKVVHTYGVLEKTVVHDASARVENQNLLYDGTTGDVVLAATENEFEDPIYHFTYPAHWVYEGMGLATENLGGTWSNISLNLLNQQNPGVLQSGDELILTDASGTTKAWVFAGAFAIDQDGNSIAANDTYTRIEIVRSGRRNQMDMEVGHLSSKVSPVATGFSSPQGVLDAEAARFSDNWNAFCGELDPCEEVVCECDESPHVQTLLAMLNALAENGDFNSYNGTAIQVPGGCNPSTFPTIPVSPQPWMPSGTCFTQAAVEIVNSCGANCTINLGLATASKAAASNYCINNIIKVVDIEPVIPSNWDGCSPIYNFNMEVELFDPCANSFPYVESFESIHSKWIQDQTDDIDWTRNQGGTPSTGTGPPAASNGAWYMYTEASSGNSPSKVGRLVLECLNIGSCGTSNMSFKYHMNGTGMGSLVLQASLNGGTSWSTLWSRNGARVAIGFRPL